MPQFGKQSANRLSETLMYMCDHLILSIKKKTTTFICWLTGKECETPFMKKPDDCDKAE